MAEMRDTDPIPTTVLRDTREQHPWTFDECAAETHDVTLSTGDYAVPADCTHDPESDTAEWSQPMAVVVETSWQTLLRNRGCMAWRDIHPNQIVGTLSAWTDHYNAAFHFAESRRQAELCAYLLLVRRSLLRRREQI